MKEVELTDQKTGDDAGDINGDTPVANSTDGEESKSVIYEHGEPAAFQTGKDYEKLYGHPDRWACLDTSEMLETDDHLVMKTHPCISKCVGITVWLMGISLISTTLWAMYIYAYAESDPTSPKYYQSKLCAAVSMLNLDVNNATLELSCSLDVPVIAVVGNFFWVIWAAFFVAVTFCGCCAPPDRVLVIEKESDCGYIRETNWNFCSLCCTRAHCGVARTVVEFTPSVVYVTMEVENRIDGVGGWGVTRWGLRNPTKVLVMRDLHDGAMLHTIDAHDIMCCYVPKLCLKETEYYLVTLKQRLEGHLRRN